MSSDSSNSREIKISTNTIVKILFSLAIVYALWSIKNILLIVLTSVVIAAFVHAGVRRFERLRIPRSVAVILLYVLGFGVFGGILWLFVPIFIEELTALAALVPEGSAFGDIIGAFNSVGGVRDLLGGASGSGQSPFEVIQSLRGEISAGGVFQSAAAIFGGFLNFILVLVISFYLSMEEKATEQFLRVVTPLQHEEYVVDLWHRSRRKIGSWFKGQLMLAAILATLTYIGLTIIGVPYAFILALVGALFGLIPYGIVLGTVPALLVAYLAGGVPTVLFVIGLYVALQQFENYVLQPVLIKKVTGVPSLIVLLSVIIGVKLLGFLGLILAIPISVVILEIIRDREARKERELVA